MRLNSASRGGSRTGGSSAATTRTAGCTATTRDLELRRNPDADDKHHFAGGPAAARERIPPGRQRQPRVGHRLSELGLARNPRCRGQARHRSSACASNSTGRINSRSGRRLAGSFTAGSGTPLSTYVITTDQIPVFVNGRGDLGRTPVLSRTDLLVSHEFRGMGSQRIRLELNVLNLFNQKTATHIYNQINRGPSGVPRQASAIPFVRRRSEERATTTTLCCGQRPTERTPTIRASGRKISSILACRANSA